LTTYPGRQQANIQNTRTPPGTVVADAGLFFNRGGSGSD